VANLVARGSGTFAYDQANQPRTISTMQRVRCRSYSRYDMRKYVWESERIGE